MNLTITIPLIIVALVLLWIIVVYNKLIKRKVLVCEAWSIIDVFLNKRHDLIPNLVESVKGYAAHEKTTFEEVARFRSMAMSATRLSDKARSEEALGAHLGRLMIIAEKYPELCASANFLFLQKELCILEDEIERARRYYNGTVRENNVAIEVFPANIVAALFRFKKADFFEAGKDEKEVPQVVIS